MKIISFVLLLTYSVFFTNAQTPIVYGEYTYWLITNFNGNPHKSKRIIFFDNQTSLEQLLYIGPAMALSDTANSSTENKEVIINEKGQTVTKYNFNFGPKEGYTPKNRFLFAKSLIEKRIISSMGGIFKGDSITASKYLINEKFVNFGWQITSERKKIGDFECIKAISKPFRGRVYEAWFTPEIPISNGPWKLHGLPGLILEAEDQIKEVKFVMEKLLLNPTERKPIYNPYQESKLPVLTWEQHEKKVREERNQTSKAFKAKGYSVLKAKYGGIELID